ncbi:hypothetical protein GCM10023322_01490 [Rugosimonospora acidiphila]|uniref:Uncharacterized protein n=1 Tax=Rugosimonospora acidiphila TaxID=556531 RepID=A0ABP9RI77_9ACTN
MVDEMDLLSQVKDVAPLRTEAYERARTSLRAVMAESVTALVPEAPGAAPARKERFSWARNLRGSLGILGKAGIGAGITVAAAGVAVVVVATSTPHSASTSHVAASAGAAGSAAKAPAVGSRLVTLAADVKASGGSLSGDASLVIRTQTADGRKPDVTYNLYTDSGDLYVTDTQRALSSAIAHHANLAEPQNAKEVAAARYAATTGDLAKAREQMVNAIPNAWGLGVSPAEAQQEWDKAMAKLQPKLKANGITSPLPRPTGKALQDDINNYVWTNSVDALSWGAANPEVRAGVLSLISTIPDVTVADSTTGGQPTLTLTAGPALFQGAGEEVLTINAKTGMPISAVMQLAPGQKPSSGTIPPSSDTFKVSRVTLSDVQAGKF